MIIFISPSLNSISPLLVSILPSLAWGKPSFAHLTIIEKLHQLHYVSQSRNYVGVWYQPKKLSIAVCLFLFCLEKLGSLESSLLSNLLSSLLSNLLSSLLSRRLSRRLSSRLSSYNKYYVNLKGLVTQKLWIWWVKYINIYFSSCYFKVTGYPEIFFFVDSWH